MSRHALTDHEWARLVSLLPSRPPSIGPAGDVQVPILSVTFCLDEAAIQPRSRRHPGATMPPRKSSRRTQCVAFSLQPLSALEYSQPVPRPTLQPRHRSTTGRPRASLRKSRRCTINADTPVATIISGTMRHLRDTTGIAMRHRLITPGATAGRTSTGRAIESLIASGFIGAERLYCRLGACPEPSPGRTARCWGSGEQRQPPRRDRRKSDAPPHFGLSGTV
jgi:hypothetical protein